MSTVLVTGAAGYVGGVVVRRLLGAANGSPVIGVDWCLMPHGAEGVRDLLDDDRLEFVRADVRDTDALRPLLRRADAVVHLAAIVGDPAGRRDPELTRAVNQEASARLVGACADEGVGHLVFVSTCSNYGIADTSALATEDHELNPVSLYAETKVAVEQLLAAQDGVPFTCLRLATVYGAAPRMRFDLTVNQFAIEAFRDGLLSIYGEQFWRPYVHVDDVARAILTVLERPDLSQGRVFNVGDSAENYTKRMMFDLLKERLPDLRAEWVHVDEDPRSYRVSFERIRGELGFEVSRRVPDGMDQILRLARLGAYPEPDAPRFRN
jgi:nucleoside-diphosphate-sugar epimerase